MFLTNNNAILDVRQGILRLPHLSMKLKLEQEQPCRSPSALITENQENQYTLYPAETLPITAKMPLLMDHDATGILTPSAQYDQHGTIFVVSTLCTVNNNAVAIQLTSFTDNPYTIPNYTHVADFTVLSPKCCRHCCSQNCCRNLKHWTHNKIKNLKKNS